MFRLNTDWVRRVIATGAATLTVCLLTAKLSGCGPAGLVDTSATDSKQDLADEGAAAQTNNVRIDSVEPAFGPPTGGTRVTIRGARFLPGTLVFFGDRVASEIQVTSTFVITCVTPAAPLGKVDVRLEYNLTNFDTLEQSFTYGGAPGAPRIVSAVSEDNTHVLLTYNEAVHENALDPKNYNIVQVNVNPEAGYLSVVGAEYVGDGQTTVRLETLAQSPVTYEIVVTNVRDLEGNVIAPPELLNIPTRTRFAGTAFDENGGGPDSDGDGLSDAAEQKGWKVYVVLVNGNISERDVVSNPNNPDTDGDGLDDKLEKNIGTDPVSADTDADELGDAAEWNDWFTDPTDQDTDKDSLNDKLELDLGTSPTTADTDGDQFDDDQEIIVLSRNPLLADLPRPQVLVGNSRITLNITSSYTDETGTTQSQDRTIATTLAQSQQRSFGTSSTVSNETQLEFGQKIGVEVGYSSKDGFGVKGSVEASFGQTFANGYSSTTNKESAQAASQEYQNSVSEGFTFSQNRSVTRTIDSAQVATDVSIQNLGDIAFTITNLELSMLQQDRRGGNDFIPIASLRLEGADDPTNQPAFNLGPFDPARGPFIFVNNGIFPNLAEDLLREPQGLIFRIVNFDILDEFGRNFVFSSQEVNDKTAGITIDYGTGVVEAYRVAINNSFDPSGLMLPITMARALEIVGLTPDADPTGDTADADPNDLTVRGSYGTQVLDDGTQVLTRVRGVQTDFFSGQDLTKRFWAVISSNRFVDPNQDFTEIPLRARDNFILAFTRDLDEDGLLEREEIFYGSSDEDDDTDGDTLGDFEEVRTGWTVTVLGEGQRKVFSDPSSTDTDLDGLTDDVEKLYGTDPTKADTDFDGLSDSIEVNGPIEIELFDGDADETNNPILFVPQYVGDEAIVNGFDGVCDSTADPNSDDVQVVPFGAAATDGQIVISAGPNGVIDSTPGSFDPNSTGDDYIRVRHAQNVHTDPLNPDTDFDGIPDGRELLLGINPNRVDAGKVVDSDNDGLSDEEEDFGWLVSVDGGPAVRITSDKFRADTDRDGIPDVLERAIATNPRSRDTDGDTLFDGAEFDVSDPLGYFNGLSIADALDRCADAQNCTYNAPDPSLIIGTDPRKKDTDGDTVNDNIELTRTWTVDTYAGDAYQVSGDPRFADKDQDNLNDAGEFAALTDPNNPDTDGDTRRDGAEVTQMLDPLRGDYNLTVTLGAIHVIGDCDAATCRGLELRGQFSLTKPDGTNVLLNEQVCVTEECACETRDCCDEQKCDGEDFVVNASSTFVFREGEQFTIFTNQLQDNDLFDCLGNGYQDIGSPYSRTFDWSTGLAVPSQDQRLVGTDTDCQVRLDYTFSFSLN